MESKTFARLGRVAAIAELFEGTGFKPFGEPLFAEVRGYATTSTKVLLEGIDFDLVYFPLKHLGYKSVLEATGELYAVLSKPRALSVVLGVSAKLDFEQVREIWSGMVQAAKEHGYASMSLDLQPSKNGLCISVSATGVEPADMKRSKAQSKDLVCVSGSLGAAYLGQRLLEAEKANFDRGQLAQDKLEKNKMLVSAYLKPELDTDVQSRIISSGVTPSFGYFVNRGLSDAVLRLQRDSGMGAKVYADKIPFEGNSISVAKELDVDPVSAAMNGGDDCRLLFVIPIMQLEAFRKEFPTFDIIGHLALPEAGATLVTPDGLEHLISAQGW